MTDDWASVFVNAHTILEKCKSAALFLRLGLPSTLFPPRKRNFRKRSSNRRDLKTQLRFGLPSTLIGHENGAFRKRFSNQRNLKTEAFLFRVDRKNFENGAFRKRWRHDNHVISLTEFSWNTNPKWPVIVALLNFSGVEWIEDIWCEPSVFFKFLRLRVEWGKDVNH